MIKVSKSLMVIVVLFILFGIFLILEDNKGLMNVTSFISVDVNNINDEYNVGDKLSGSALLIIEEGDFLLKEDRLKLTVLDDTMVIVSKEVTLEQFMLKVTNPSALTAPFLWIIKF